MLSGKKKCSKCKKLKGLNEFYRNKANKDGHTSWCKVCYVKRNDEMYKNNSVYKEKTLKQKREHAKKCYDKEKERLRRLKKEYGLTITDFIKMLVSQRSVCKICGKPETAKDKNGCIRWLAVDHCHVTGKIRGLLCASCNIRLFWLESSHKIWVNKAKAYMKEY